MKITSRSLGADIRVVVVPPTISVASSLQSVGTTRTPEEALLADMIDGVRRGLSMAMGVPEHLLFGDQPVVKLVEIDGVYVPEKSS